MLHAATFIVDDGTVDVRSWGYQLQGLAGTPLTVPPLVVASHDLLVMDFSSDGTEGAKFTSSEIDQIQHGDPALGGDGSRKVVVAYVSIGEASEFRSYWDPAWTVTGTASGALTASAPSWLGPVNPDFPESRKVRYWDPAWQALIFSTAGTGWLDQTLSQGFDGAYLDIVDAYFFWGEEATPSQRRPGDPVDVQDAARRMIDFVVALTAHARQTVPGFFSIPQNGEFILEDADGGPLAPDPMRRAAYLDAIGGIGIEDTYYRGNLDENNVLDPDLPKIAVLQSDFAGVSKPVFVVDYLNDAAKIDVFAARAVADGFHPHAAPTRDLDRLGPPIPVPEPAGLLSSMTALVLVAFLGSRKSPAQPNRAVQASTSWEPK